MTERTNEDKFNRAPVTVMLGGQGFKILPAPMRRRNLWRARVLRRLKSFGLDIGDAEALNHPERHLEPDRLLELSAALADLLFDYAQWPADVVEWIDNRASDEEMTAALAACLMLANPTTPAATMTGTAGETTAAATAETPGANAGDLSL